MSLPTYAKYYNKDGDMIATVFVNVGWFLDAKNFAEAVTMLPWFKPAKSIELYGITIPGDLMVPPDDVEFEMWKQEIMEQATPMIKAWQARNEDLRQHMIKLFEEAEHRGEVKRPEPKEKKEEKVPELNIPKEKKIILNSGGFGLK